MVCFKSNFNVFFSFVKKAQRTLLVLVVIRYIQCAAADLELQTMDDNEWNIAMHRPRPFAWSGHITFCGERNIRLTDLTEFQKSFHCFVK